MLRIVLAVQLAVATGPAGAGPAEAATEAAEQGEPSPDTEPDPPADEGMEPEARASSGDEAPAANRRAPTAARGIATFGPGVAGDLEVVASDGAVTARLSLEPGQTVELDLPAGRYRLQENDGQVLTRFEVQAGEIVAPPVPAEMRVPVEPTPEALDEAEAPPPPPSPSEPPPTASRKSWTRWGAPLLSALVPGVGQMVNREIGKGIGILVSTAGLLVGSVAMARARDPADGAGGEGDSTQDVATEITILAAHAGFTGALGLLYAGQIMDARAVATDQVPDSETDHKVNVNVVRMSTIGFRPGEPDYGLCNDWSLSVMGQVVPRFSIGVSDLSFKRRSASNRNTFQGGVRLTYRVLERRRIWLGLGLGSLVQATVASGRPVPLEVSEPLPDDVTEFGATVYGQFETRLFLLDRWSLNLIPRLSVPMTTRYYSGRRSLPRFTPTFELGLGTGVYF